MEKTEYEIDTYEKGIQIFVIGKEYRAMGTCGMSKDIEVKGVLRVDKRFNSESLVLYSERRGIMSINKKTLN